MKINNVGFQQVFIIVIIGKWVASWVDELKFE